MDLRNFLKCLICYTSLQFFNHSLCFRPNCSQEDTDLLIFDTMSIMNIHIERNYSSIYSFYWNSPKKNPFCISIHRDFMNKAQNNHKNILNKYYINNVNLSEEWKIFTSVKINFLVYIFLLLKKYKDKSTER